MVASVPIAMQGVCTSTMALESRALAENKPLCHGWASIEVLAGIDMLCSGQTGTFTLHGSVSRVGFGRSRHLWRHG